MAAVSASLGQPSVLLISAQSESVVSKQRRKAPKTKSSASQTPAYPTTKPRRMKTTTPKVVAVHGTKTPRNVPSPRWLPLWELSRKSSSVARSPFQFGVLGGVCCGEPARRLASRLLVWLSRRMMSP